jgi:acetoin utilization protein AcuB
MQTSPEIISIMTPLPHSIEASRSIHEAKAIMDVEQIRHLPVTSEARLVGMLSERELRLAYAIGATQNSTAPLNVGDVCNLEAYVTDFETPISEVLTELIEKKIASALITRNGKLVGIVTNTDIYRHYRELLKVHYPDA